jgi:PAS domain S-box-containing protein
VGITLNYTAGFFAVGFQVNGSNVFKGRFETIGRVASLRDMMLGIDFAPETGTPIEAAGCAVALESRAAAGELQRVADASAAMLWMADSAGLCTFANRSWLEFRGRTLEEELGSGWAEGMHQEDALVALTSYWSAVRAGRPFSIEYRVLAKEGVYYRAERFGSPWPGGYAGCVILGSPQNPIDWEARRQLATLSARERQVLEMIAEGRSTKAIAESLTISYKTADSHRTHLLKKLGIHETATLVRFAIRAGAVEA